MTALVLEKVSGADCTGPNEMRSCVPSELDDTTTSPNGTDSDEYLPVRYCQALSS